MNTPIKAYQSLLSERAAIIVIIAVIAFLWSVNQLSLLSLFMVGGISSFLLVQLEMKRRLQDLKNKRLADFEKKITHKREVKSLRSNALDGVPSPILLIDSNNIISFANSPACNLLGEDIVSNDVFLYLRQSNFVAALEKVLSGDEGNAGAIRYTNSQGRSFDVTVAPVGATSTDTDTSMQAMVFFYEVTSLLQTEQMRVDFVANASHELRTPLTTITGFIETLQGPASNDSNARSRFLDIMSRESGRMIRLIDDLLSLSRIEMTRHVAPDQSLDLESLVTSTIRTVSAQAAERGLEFKTHLEPSLPKVLVDSDQITQVFLNLVGNAVKYADAHTTIHISATPHHSGRNLVVSIRDEGPGIAPEHLARLTERFYRVDTARSRKMGGTGLGLAIVKHILLRHSSQLEIKSSVGEGTNFSFKLPIAKQ
ncbi:MAG: sensor histidine kinase [Kordiimonas sp.]